MLCNKMKTWKQEFLVVVYISLLLQHSDTGEKATWPLHENTTWSVLSGSIFPSAPIKGWAGPFMITLTMPRQSNWNATDRGLRVSDRSGWSVRNNQPLALCSYDNIRVGFRNWW